MKLVIVIISEIIIKQVIESIQKSQNTVFIL